MRNWTKINSLSRGLKSCNTQAKVSWMHICDWHRHRCSMQMIQNYHKTHTSRARAPLFLFVDNLIKKKFIKRVNIALHFQLEIPRDPFVSSSPSIHEICIHFCKFLCCLSQLSRIRYFLSKNLHWCFPLIPLPIPISNSASTWKKKVTNKVSKVYV